MRVVNVLVFLAVFISSANIVESQSVDNSSVSKGAHAISEQQRLAALNEANQALVNAIPDFTCDETIDAVEQKNGLLKTQTHVTAQFRVVKSRTATSFSLRDGRTLLTINGKPTKKNKFSSPIMLSGVVGYALGFFNDTNMACYDVSLRSESEHLVEYDLRRKDDISGLKCATFKLAPRALVSFDPTTLTMRHFEVAMPSKKNTESPTMLINFHTVTLGGNVYDLPETVTSSIAARKGHSSKSWSWQSQYSGCVLFKATATILPDYSEVPQ